MLKKYLLPIISAIIGVFPIASKAQEETAQKDSSTLSLIQLSEIVVKATKNHSKIKDLPTSISVMPQSFIEHNEVKLLNEVTAIVPNFCMPDYGSKLTSPVYIRGIGSRINSPSVGLYVDNVPYFEKSAFEFDFFDIERLEVLRGPQGTLYGRNSMGGLIHITTRSPIDYQGTQIKISAGNYGNYTLGAGHYNKLNEKWATSLSANYRHSGGFYKNAYGAKNVGALHSYSLNHKLIYSPLKNLQCSNFFSMEISDQDGYPYALLNDSLNTAQDVNYNQESTYRRKLVNDAVSLKYEQQNWELNNVFSFQFLDGKQNVDQDFTPDSIYYFQYSQTQDMFADEVILKSKGKRKYEWLFGGFVFRQSFKNSLESDVYLLDMRTLRNYKPLVKGRAVFHQSTYNITEQLSVVAGIRFDNESSVLEYDFSGNRASYELPKTDTLYPKLSESIFLPKIALNYKFKNSLFYASYTTGYKAGGFNDTFEKPEHLMFKHEKSFNYEVGMKGTYFKDLLYVDAAVFYTDLKSQQIYRSVPSGRGAYLDNVGTSANKGLELSVNSRFYKGFTAMLAYGYTDSKILEYVKDSTSNYNQNITPYIPKQTLAIQLNHTIFTNAIRFLDKIQWNVLYRLKGKQYWNLENTYQENQYQLLDAKISFIKNNIRLDFWGKNLLNEKYNAFLFTIKPLHNTYVQEGKPFQMGINLSIEF